MTQLSLCIHTYVLDTNVLIHDPTAVLNFDEHTVVIPTAVLEELDGIKQEQSDRGRQARQATRLLDSLIEELGMITTQAEGSTIFLPAPVCAQHPQGKLKFISDTHQLDGLDAAVKDNKILATAYGLHVRAGDGSVTLVTNDTNMRVKAAVYGLHAEGYRNDAVFTDSDSMIDGFQVVTDMWDGDTRVNHHRNYRFGQATYASVYEISGPAATSWTPGLYVSDGRDFLGRVLEVKDGTALVKIPVVEMHGWGISPRDTLQACALDMLLDSEIDLVTLAGPAGTGKTFLALAAAAKMVVSDGLYEKIVVTRETVAMGEEIGFLPGTEEEKMAPWMGAFHDNIEHLAKGWNGPDSKRAGEDSSKVIERDKILKERIQMRSLGLMRGRSFKNTILIIDEAQNLTPKQMKSIVTRAGQGSKIICLGNVAQIDTPYLNAGSTGLANLVQKFRGWEHAGHITLKGIERSRLAAKAEELL